MKKIFNYKTFLSIGLAMAPAIMFAQQVVTKPTDPTTPASAPLDGGLSLLAAAGISYGVKKFKDNKKKNRNTENNK